MSQVASDTTRATDTATQVPTVRPCLTYRDHAEEAVRFYVSVFPNSRIVSLVRSDGNGPIPKGGLVASTFELNGREFVAFDGGETFTFTEGMSLMVTCETQAEIDELWTGLTAGGGEEGPCGWLKDRFGVSWQIVPSALGDMLADSKSGSPAKMVEALLKMRKLDLNALRRAYRGEA